MVLIEDWDIVMFSSLTHRMVLSYYLIVREIIQAGTVTSLWTLKPGNEDWSRAVSRKNGAPDPNEANSSGGHDEAHSG